MWSTRQEAPGGQVEMPATLGWAVKAQGGAVQRPGAEGGRVHWVGPREGKEKPRWSPGKWGQKPSSAGCLRARERIKQSS